jgi:murein DD-endopeptidase MepM/ murein hydrolase activator NlpD
VVARGESVGSIAQEYGYRTGDILAINRSVDPRRLKVGTSLRLPGTQVQNIHVAAAQVPAPTGNRSRTEPVAAQSSPAAATPAAIKFASLPQPRPGKQPPAAVRADPPQLTGDGFMWPVDGEVISAFGPQPNGAQNDGINLRAAVGTTVISVENGVVVYAGSDIPAFGRMLMVRHDGDYLSAYAHNSTLLVAEGDKVRRGQPIAKVGATGHVLEPQLHFELRKGRDVVDPAKYLRGGNLQFAQKN